MRCSTPRKTRGDVDERTRARIGNRKSTRRMEARPLDDASVASDARGFDQRVNTRVRRRRFFRDGDERRVYVS